MESSEEELLAQLASEDGAVRARATRLLWERWFSEHGQEGMEAFHRAAELAESGSWEEAEEILTALILRFPSYAEAYNQRAVLRFQQGDYEGAAGDCNAATQRKPWHFGAWYGLGLCRQAQRQYAAAATAFREALRWQPHGSREALERCLAQLN